MAVFGGSGVHWANRFLSVIEPRGAVFGCVPFAASRVDGNSNRSRTRWGRQWVCQGQTRSNHCLENVARLVEVQRPRSYSLSAQVCRNRFLSSELARPSLRPSRNQRRLWGRWGISSARKRSQG